VIGFVTQSEWFGLKLVCLVWGWFVSRGSVGWCRVSWCRVCWCRVCWCGVCWCGVSGLVGRGGFVGWGWGAVWGLVSSFDFLDFGVESVVVGGVFDDAGGTVGFQEAVRSLDVTVGISVFGLALDVVCGRVVDAVFEVVWLGWVGGFRSVGFWCGVCGCGVCGCWVSGRWVSGLVGRGGVLSDGGNHACGEDDQL